MAAQDNPRRIFRIAGERDQAATESHQPRVDDRRVGPHKHRAPTRQHTNGHRAMECRRDSPVPHRTRGAPDRYGAQRQPVRAGRRTPECDAPGDDRAPRSSRPDKCRVGPLADGQPHHAHGQRPRRPRGARRRARPQHRERHQEADHPKRDPPCQTAASPSMSPPGTHKAAKATAEGVPECTHAQSLLSRALGRSAFPRAPASAAPRAQLSVGKPRRLCSAVGLPVARAPSETAFDRAHFHSVTAPSRCSPPPAWTS